MDIKDCFRKFRQWQRIPRKYGACSCDMQHCHNCDADFEGNYCPVCGQKAGSHRITWACVWEGVMSVWGAGDRSMPYSLLQLLGRTGYFIGDYISGRRRISFPPVRMLIIVAIIVTIVEHLLGADDGNVVFAMDGEERFMTKMMRWLNNNPGWGALAGASLFVLPTWFLFRFSPRHTRHTLPEGFFIQVFMVTLLLLIVTLSDLLGDWLGILIPVYYIMAYHQLFGYGLWGTIWRISCCFLASLLHMMLLVCIINIIVGHKLFNDYNSVSNEFMVIMFTFLASSVIIGVGYLISRHTRIKEL